MLYILGGSAIKLPSYNDDGKECNKIIYGIQVFTKCNGSYVNVSIGDDAYIQTIETYDRGSKGNKLVVNPFEQILRYINHYFNDVNMRLLTYRITEILAINDNYNAESDY